MNKASGGDGIPVVLLQNLKEMPWKCCTEYASKFGKLSSAHRTGKGQFLFQSQRKAMPKNAQTTVQLHSSHTLGKKCSKFFKPGFNSIWTVNFQMFKLDLEKAEEPEIKLPTSDGSSKKQEFQKNIYFCFIDCPKAFDSVDHNKLWKNYQSTWPASWEICMQIRKQQLELDIIDWFQVGKGARQGCILSLCLF